MKGCNYSISIVLDRRRKKANGKYPVRLRVYSTYPRRQKFIITNYDLTEREFQGAWISSKPRKEYKKLRLELQVLEMEANDIAKNLWPFDFDLFERKLLRKPTEKDNVFHYYDIIIKKKIDLKAIKTAQNYSYSVKSIKRFLRHVKGKESTKLSFFEIDYKWLHKYEEYMLEVRGCKLATVGIHLRPLKAVFNEAIRERDIPSELYPFGKGKYQIPVTSSFKRALSEEQLRILFHVKPTNQFQEKARDFWFFSYACNGMNFKDICLLKFENLIEEKLIFHRAKTLNTSRANLKPIIAYLTDFPIQVIKKYSGDRKNPGEYIFGIVDKEDDEVEKHRKIEKFIRFTNQHISILGSKIGLPFNISTYWARHSFATNAIKNGATMEFVCEALSHSNIKTTQSYFGGFESQWKREIAEKLMDL